MEVNKEEAARCRDLGAAALKSNQYARAIKMLNKSLHLYPLPGVKALLGQAERKLAAEGENLNTNTTSSATNGQQESNGGNSTHSSSARSATNGTTSRSSSTTSLPNNSTHSASTIGADGRQYTSQQLSIVTQVLKARSSGGRSVHYKVLCIERNADDSAIKKAYRKLGTFCLLFCCVFVCIFGTCNITGFCIYTSLTLYTSHPYNNNNSIEITSR